MRINDIKEATVKVAPSAGKSGGSTYVIYSAKNNVFFDGHAWVHSGLNAKKMSKDSTAQQWLAKAQKSMRGADADIYVLSYDISKAGI